MVCIHSRDKRNMPALLWGVEAGSIIQADEITDVQE